MLELYINSKRKNAHVLSSKKLIILDELKKKLITVPELSKKNIINKIYGEGVGRCKGTAGFKLEIDIVEKLNARILIGQKV